MIGDFIDIDLKRTGIRKDGAKNVAGFVDASSQRNRIRIFEDGQKLSGPVARAFIRRYGVETATIGLTGLGADSEEVASRIEDSDVFTVTAYHGVFLEMLADDDFPGVIIELADLRSCVDFDGSEVRRYAVEAQDA